MTKFKTFWFWDSGIKAGDSKKYVMSFYDDSHPKPSFIRNEKLPNHMFCHSFNTLDSNGHQLIHFLTDDYVGTPDCWYVDILDKSIPQMQTIMSFCDGRFPNGTVIPFSEAVEIGVDPQKSSGFVRWFTDDSRIQQIYVAPDFRRKRISIKLVGIADLTIVSDINWNGIFLNGGDITTSDGETLREAWSKSTRVTPRQGKVE